MINYRTLLNETKKLSVLFVEDYTLLRLEMGEVLGEFFNDVVVAQNGQEAFDIYQHKLQKNERFDLVISDIQMPIMNGVVLSKKIREVCRTQSIIILSGHSDSAYLIDLINIGVSKFLTKPIVDDELFFVLHDEAKKINSEKNKLPVEKLTEDLGDGYIWDSNRLMLMHQENVVELTRHELLLLMFFLNKKNYICITEEIIEIFSMNNIVLSEKNIRNLVFKLRKKVPSKWISSVYGLGYKFTLE